MSNKLTTTLAATALMFSVGSVQANELFFYNWTDYTPEDMLQKFEKETGIKVTMDTYDSNETLLAKLKSGATGYDLAVPSSNFVTIMVAEGLIEKVDVKSMSNYKNVDPRFQGPAWDPDQMYTSPYQYGTTSFAIRTDKGLSCDSLKTFFEPEGEACGNLGVFATPEEVVSMAQLYLGQKYCQDDSDSLKALQALLQKQSKCVKIFSSESTMDRLVDGTTYLSNAWNGDAMKARLEEDGKIEYCHPKEGVVGWFDSLVIPKGAKNVENAKTFMNWLMAPENMAMVSNFARYANAIPESAKYLDPVLASAPETNPPSDIEVRVSETCSARFVKATDKIWTKLRQ